MKRSKISQSSSSLLLFFAVLSFDRLLLIFGVCVFVKQFGTGSAGCALEGVALFPGRIFLLPRPEENFPLRFTLIGELKSRMKLI